MPTTKTPIVEGATATNPQTGEKIVYRSGKWLPLAQDMRGMSDMLSPQERASLDDARNAGTNAIGVLDTLTQFQNLNEGRGVNRQPTGGLNSVGNYLAQGIDPEVQRMQGLTATIAPGKRQPGSGTTSDRDLALFLKGSPSAFKDEAANTGIIEDGRREAVRRQQYAAFLDKWAKQYGTLNGAQEAFLKVVGAGTRQSPYSIEEAGDRSTLPRGAYYQSREGLRRNDNGPRGNPIIEPARNAFAPHSPAPVISGAGWKIIP